MDYKTILNLMKKNKVAAASILLAIATVKILTVILIVRAIKKRK